MYTPHPVFEKPDNENTKIWRYLDFTKFVSLLDKKALFFSRADKLFDKFEGSYSKANINIRPALYKYLPKEAQKNMVEARKELTEFSKQIRKYTIINSWHMNQYESAAMWKLYLKSDEGVAIQSTFKRLTVSFNNYLENAVYIGKIRYIDYETDLIPEGFTFYPFLHKRKSFEHENEIRAIIQDIPITDNKIDLKKVLYDDGAYIPIELDILIDKIYVSPTALGWFTELVRSIVNKYNLKKEVLQSSLIRDPVY